MDAADEAHRALMQRLPRVLPIQDQNKLEAVKEAARSDGHFALLGPSDMVVNGGGEIIGCASLGSVHGVHAWLHSSKVSPSETVYLMNLFEEIGRARGMGLCILPVRIEPPHCQLYPQLQEWGWKKLGKFELLGKRT